MGPDDQAGALNEITPAVVLDAVRLVRSGRVHDLAHVLHADVPAFPGRTFRQYLTTNYHHDQPAPARARPGGLGRNSVNWVVEQVTATQQMGTHMDALNHLQVGDRTYNGHRLADIAEDHGTNRLGVDTLPQVVTRGLLLDVARVRGVDRLQPGDVITVADAEAALDDRTVRPGDAVLFHTGWGRWWGVDNDRYASGEPGPGHGAGRVAGRAPGRADRLRHLELRPGARRGPGRAVRRARRRSTSGTASSCWRTCGWPRPPRDGLHEFLLVITHAKLRGATGAWVAPLAIV